MATQPCAEISVDKNGKHAKRIIERIIFDFIVDKQVVSIGWNAIVMQVGEMIAPWQKHLPAANSVNRFEICFYQQ